MNSIKKDTTPLALALAAVALLGTWVLHADELEMMNGDHYVGKILSLNTNTVIWKSEVLGTVNLPREKVSKISLGSAIASALPRASAHTNLQGKASLPVAGNNSPEQTAVLSQLRSNSNLMHKVETQFLSDADPAAKSKYNELMAGLMSGKLNIGDIRAEAKSASDQLRSLKKDTGDSTGILDGYLEILDKFVAETEGATPSATNKVPSAAKPASVPSAK